ncbi:MAG: hypothetical protein ABSA11_09785 [Candidatus Bathyarchaeia archaeon]|jgi:hypothetical protein
MKLTVLPFLEIFSGIFELIIGIGSLVLGINFQSFITTLMSTIPQKYIPTQTSYFNYLGLIGAGFGITFIVLAVSSFLRAWFFMRDKQSN